MKPQAILLTVMAAFQANAGEIKGFRYNHCTLKVCAEVKSETAHLSNRLDGFVARGDVSVKVSRDNKEKNFSGTEAVYHPEIDSLVVESTRSVVLIDLGDGSIEEILKGSTL